LSLRIIDIRLFYFKYIGETEQEFLLVISNAQNNNFDLYLSMNKVFKYQKGISYKIQYIANLLLKKILTIKKNIPIPIKVKI
tara:strand:+ start:423 stop:668 length:246 start_codon:yes stop_codon:yes gene_type:complete